MKTCVQCGILLGRGQYAYQGGRLDRPQCRAWVACEGRIGHTYDRQLNLKSCVRDVCYCELFRQREQARAALAGTPG